VGPIQFQPMLEEDELVGRSAGGGEKLAVEIVGAEDGGFHRGR
jgi:hypothetical protein